MIIFPYHASFCLTKHSKAEQKKTENKESKGRRHTNRSNKNKTKHQNYTNKYTTIITNNTTSICIMIICIYVHYVQSFFFFFLHLFFFFSSCEPFGILPSLFCLSSFFLSIDYLVAVRLSMLFFSSYMHIHIQLLIPVFFLFFLSFSSIAHVHHRGVHKCFHEQTE